MARLVKHEPPYLEEEAFHIPRAICTHSEAASASLWIQKVKRDEPILKARQNFVQRESVIDLLLSDAC